MRSIIVLKVQQISFYSHFFYCNKVVLRYGTTGSGVVPSPYTVYTSTTLLLVSTLPCIVYVADGREVR